MQCFDDGGAHDVDSPAMRLLRSPERVTYERMHIPNVNDALTFQENDLCKIAASCLVSGFPLNYLIYAILRLRLLSLFCLTAL
jgi:hypothetical protein